MTSNNYGYTPNNDNNGQQGYHQQGYPQQGYTQQNQNQQYQAPGFNPTPNMGAFDAYGNPIPNDAKTVALLSHLSSIALYILSATFLNFLGPLIFWMIYKDKPGYHFVTSSSARAFNFSFTIWVVNVVAWIATFITLGFAGIITVPILAITGVVLLVFHVIGAVKASNGEVYDYPMQIRVLKD